MIVATVVSDYTRRQPPLYAEEEGRIQFVEANGNNSEGMTCSGNSLFSSNVFLLLISLLFFITAVWDEQLS